MATLFIMCGLPFSGKTYLAKRIAERFGIVGISYDELWREVNEKESRNPSWEELCLIAESRIAAELKADRSIVYDTLNDTVGNREKLRKVAESVGGKAIIVYANTPLEVVRQRYSENKNSKERHDVPEDKIQEAIDRFEPPQTGETFVERKPDQDLNNWFGYLKNFTKWH